MNTSNTRSGTTHSTISLEQRDALIRRGNALRAEAFARALAAVVRPFTGRSVKRSETSGTVVDVHGKSALESTALLSRGESWVGHDGRNAA